jgi:uridine kinase
MTNTEKLLNKWSEQIDPKLPAFCPNCHKKLDAIRYTTEKETLSIQLTKKTIEHIWHKAYCPYCEHLLKKEIRE